VGVKRLAGKRQVGLADGFVHGWVGVNQGCDVFWVSLPVDDELGLADLLADTRTNHVNTDDWSVVAAHELDEASGAENLALAVATQVVFVDRDVLCTKLLGSLGLGQTNRGNQVRSR